MSARLSFSSTKYGPSVISGFAAHVAVDPLLSVVAAMALLP
jgi:hypothetical protein